MSNFAVDKQPTKWKVTPSLPKGMSLNPLDGSIGGSVMESGGVAFHRQQEVRAYLITCASVDSAQEASARLTVHFVDKALRPNMGACVACGDDIKDGA